MGVPTSEPSVSVAVSGLLAFSCHGSRLQAPEFQRARRKKAALSVLAWLRSDTGSLPLHSDSGIKSRSPSDSSAGDRDPSLSGRSVQVILEKSIEDGRCCPVLKMQPAVPAKGTLGDRA